MSPETSTWFTDRLVMFIPVLLSLSVHEWAHAWAAYLLGDDTAEKMGRMTLNPLEHIDPIGTFILPLLGVPFGWAKPVPFNAARFRRGIRMTRGTMIVAAAGPLSNLALGTICIFLTASLPLLLDLHSHKAVAQLLLTMTVVNFSLAVFNLLPIPPLDGSHIAEALMPRRLQKGWSIICGFGIYLILGLILALQTLPFIRSLSRLTH